MQLPLPGFALATAEQCLNRFRRIRRFAPGDYQNPPALYDIARTMTHSEIAIIKGDGIGIDVTEATLAVIDAAREACGGFSLEYRHILAGAGYFADSGLDIEAGGEQAAGDCDAIFLGAIGLPAIRHADGTEISPHLRLRDIFGLYAGVRPVKAYPNAPQRLADDRARNFDLVIPRWIRAG